MEIFDKMQTPRISQKAADGAEEFIISVWNGKLQIAVGNGSPGAPIWKQSFAGEGLSILVRTLKSVSQAQPGTKKSLIFQKYDPDQKKNVVDSTIVIGKDDKQLFFIEAQFRANGAPKSIRFTLKAGNTISTGEDFNDQARSSARLAYIIDYLEKTVPTAMLLSGRKFEGAPGGQKSGGGYNKPSYGGGNNYPKKEAASAPSFGDEDTFG